MTGGINGNLLSVAAMAGFSLAEWLFGICIDEAEMIFISN